MELVELLVTKYFFSVYALTNVMKSRSVHRKIKIIIYKTLFDDICCMKTRPALCQRTLLIKQTNLWEKYYEGYLGTLINENYMYRSRKHN